MVVHRTVVVVFLAVTDLPGCYESPRVGLPNVRAQEWPQTRVGKTRDVIANGDDSCASAGNTTSDPMPIRAVPCRGKDDNRASVAPPGRDPSPSATDAGVAANNFGDPAQVTKPGSSRE